jgi:CheY-like chemotaxis protein
MMPPALKILIAEDELLTALQLSRALSKAGYETLEPVINGDEVLAAFFAAHPDLILLDVNLQGNLSGIEAALRIREQSQTPIIFMTGYTDDKTLTDIQAVKNAAVIAKPLTLELLHETIRRMIDSANS